MKSAHIPAYQKLSEYYIIVACCDIIEDRARFAAELFGAKAYTDYREMLKSEELDAVDIAVPNYLHSPIAVDALNSGINVLCEKPDAVSIEAAKAMGDAAEANGKVLMVMRNNRFLDMSRFLKSYIDDGKMGEIYAGRCGWQRRRGIPGKGGWFTTKEKSGGGPLIDLGVHMIDLAIYFMGNSKPVAVSGCTYMKFADSDVSDSVNSAFGDKIEGGTFDVEDLAMGFIRFSNGACLQIEFSWASNVEKEKVFVELRGEKAGSEWNSCDGQLKIFTEENGATVDLIPHVVKHPYCNHCGMIHHFAEVLLEGKEPIFIPEQGLNMVKILEGIYESAKTGREVRL